MQLAELSCAMDKHQNKQRVRTAQSWKTSSCCTNVNYAIVVFVEHLHRFLHLFLTNPTR